MASGADAAEVTSSAEKAPGPPCPSAVPCDLGGALELSEPAGVSACGQRFLSSRPGPSPPSPSVVLGPPFTPPCPAPVVALRAPAFYSSDHGAQHVVAPGQAASLHRCPPTWEQRDRLPSLPRWLWAGPGLPARALPGCGWADSRGRMPKTQRPAQRRRHLGRVGTVLPRPSPPPWGKGPWLRSGTWAQRLSGEAAVETKASRAQGRGAPPPGRLA